MFRLALVLASLFTLADWLCAASPDPADLAVPAEVQVKARKLVERLGSEDYAEREEAQKQLTELGRLARPALLHAAKAHPSPEVRLRCAELLPHASALAFRAQIDAFLADTNGQYEHDLPAWKQFRALACREWSFCGHVVWSDRGVEKAAREVFAGLVAAPANRRLLAAVGGSPIELSSLAALRRQEFGGQGRFRNANSPPRDPTLEEMTTLLFAEGLLGSQQSPRRRSINYMMSAAGFTGAARGTDEKAAVYRAVASAWIRSRNDPREMAQAISLASNLDLTDEACELALRLFTRPGVMAFFRGQAAAHLYELGGKKHVRHLEKLIDDATVIYTVRTLTETEAGGEGKAHEIQLRDLTLAILVHLTGQKLTAYGFADRYGEDPAVDNRAFAYTRYYFPDEGRRAKAFAKWAEWRKSHPDE